MEKTYTEQIQIHKENRMAGLYPSTKLLVVLMYTLCTFFISSLRVTRYNLPLFLIPWFLVVIFICAISGSLKKCVKAFSAVAFIAVLILLVQTFIVPGDDLVWRSSVIHFLRIYSKGLRTGLNLSFMIMDVAGMFVWMFQTTSTQEMSRALDASGMNYQVTYIFTSTFQMINILSDDSKTIMNAQKARGVETEGNLIVRARAFVPTLVPLILGALVGAEERVLTLEARGFNLRGEKTSLFNLERSGLERTVIIVSFIVTAIIIAGRIVLWIL